MASSYEVPSWAGKPPGGLHLDIFKDDKFIQKIMIDEKKCYLFGRNPDLNDFRIDHSSCSRVHAALVYHKHLNLTYLVDLGSTHGTFIGNIRLEAQKPTVVQIGSSFHFGASTRSYTLRERIKTQQNIVEDLPSMTNEHIPATQDEVDNLTEYNTAHNRKISTLGISDVQPKKGAKRKRVHFNEEEIVINPEDIDPSIGRFRNLVQSTVVPMSNKRMRLESPSTFTFPPPTAEQHKHILHHPIINLYDGLPSAAGNNPQSEHDDNFGAFSSKFMPSLPNPAPEIENKVVVASSVQFKHDEGEIHPMDYEHEPKKKKYAKETWFGPKQRPTKAFGDI